ncbi:manganese transporter [Chryseotalea sanaruensis]|uniref:Manganese transporter n=1 Tax=Chryseotalea sanaruensis TaxID=2482724 RepID=A0A401U5Z8_9BACT|nr:zinc ABC transporter substrate-binding protein [Chryseotalea sanaruensis]GCC50216.1 manganese transporter [Chryseotalea sanaruensis]
MLYKFQISNFKFLNATLPFFLVFTLVIACKPKQKGELRERLMIVTTTGMIADAVKNVTGDGADVISLMGAGVDPHLYKATQGDLQKLTDADVIFYNGLHLEGKMAEVLEKLGRTKTVIPVTQAIQENELRLITEGIHDPHIWFDVKLWKNAVVEVEKNLSTVDSAKQHVYKVNAARYLTQLDSLDNAVSQQIQTIPATQRVLITAHDAFGYFGDAYAMEVRGLQGISTVSEFGLKDVTELVDFIISRKIKAIFVETSVSEKSINAVIEGCQNKGWQVSIGGSLYSDAMGEANTPEGTYIGMVSKNVSTIVSALQ